jgi:hypothetical protein
VLGPHQNGTRFSNTYICPLLTVFNAAQTWRRIFKNAKSATVVRRIKRKRQKPDNYFLSSVTPRSIAYATLHVRNPNSQHLLERPDNLIVTDAMVSMRRRGLEKERRQSRQTNVILHHHQPLQEKGHENLVRGCITGMEQVSYYEQIRTDTNMF